MEDECEDYESEENKLEEEENYSDYSYEDYYEEEDQGSDYFCLKKRGRSQFSYSILEPGIVDGKRSMCLLELEKHLEAAFQLRLPEFKLLKVLEKTRWHMESAKTYMGDHITDLIECVPPAPLEFSDPAEKKLLCEICWNEDPMDRMLGLECNHYYCLSCYKSYVVNAVRSDVKAAVFLGCPFTGCPCIIPSSFFERLLDRPDLERLKRFTRRCFVENSYNLALCSDADCQNAYFLKFEGTDKENLSQADLWCTCLRSRCLKCESEAHLPVPCKLFDLWLKKVEGKDDSVTKAWIKSNTKSCPKCSVQIEKNQGCMHMTCMKCKHEFCWLCMGDWKIHGSNTGGFYSCNQFKGDTQNADLEKKELEKFNHYSSRYIEHAKSCRLAKKKLEDLKKKFDEDPRFKIQSSTNFEPFLAAHTTSLHARQTVTSSYGLSFQIKDDPKRDLLDLNLYYLEKALENLDKNLESIDIDSWFVKDFNKYTLSSNFAMSRTTTNNLRDAVEANFKNFIADTMKTDFLEAILTENQAGKELKRVEMVVKMEVEGWECPQCTLHNSNNRRSCEMCLFTRTNPRIAEMPGIIEEDIGQFPIMTVPLQMMPLPQMPGPIPQLRAAPVLQAAPRLRQARGRGARGMGRGRNNNH